MTAANETYDVFVSYSRADGRHAAEIDSILHNKGLRSFFDRRNLDPGLPWVRALEKAIGSAKTAIVLIGPRGLDAFREEDSALFFGRGSLSDPESPIGQLVRNVREHRFVMVVGRSGSGKSSLVFAGLV